jgi:hypothetical protein
MFRLGGWRIRERRLASEVACSNGGQETKMNSWIARVRFLNSLGVRQDALSLKAACAPECQRTHRSLRLRRRGQRFFVARSPTTFWRTRLRYTARCAYGESESELGRVCRKHNVRFEGDVVERTRPPYRFEYMHHFKHTRRLRSRSSLDLAKMRAIRGSYLPEIEGHLRENQFDDARLNQSLMGALTLESAPECIL